MHLISSYVPPSATSHAIKCNLGHDLLVVARINRLDAYETLPDGVRLVNSLEVLPRIVALHEISPNDDPGALLVITDHPDCSALLVEYSTSDKTLSVTSSQRLLSAYGLPLAGCISCAVSQDRRWAAVALYQGIIHILEFKRRGESVVVSTKFECAIREILLSSFCFVPYTNEDTLALAFLHRTHTGQRCITVRTVDEDNRDISSEAIEIDMQDPETAGLVPVAPKQGTAGGILVYGGDQLAFYEFKDADEKRESPKRCKMSNSSRRPDASVPWPHSTITGYDIIDEDRLLLSDQYGKLVLLSLGRSDKNRINQISPHLLGEFSSAKCIAYLNAGVAFLGSETGDSYLVQINPAGEVNVIDTFQSIAPISDAVLADLDNSGQPIVVTSSGGGRTGSLRIVRTGANIEELGSIAGIDGIKCTFPLSDTDGPHSHLLLSFQRETRLVDTRGIDSFSEIPSKEFPGLIRDHVTITAANVTSEKGEVTTLAIQVTSIAAVLFDVQSGMEYHRWVGDITVACVKGNSLCLGVQGGRVVTLFADVDQAKLIPRADVKFNQEVSAVSVYLGNPHMAIVGFWEEYKVEIFSFDTMKPLKGGSDIEMPHVPRSIMAWSFGSDRHSQVYLLVGTGNGQLVSLRLNTKRDVIDMSSRRITSLGDQPVRLCAYHVDGKNVVMATGNRTVLLSPKQQRITQHHVNVKNIQNAVEFNTTLFPDSILFNLPTGLTVVRIVGLEKLKVDTISLGSDIPITMAYHQEANAFAIGCVRTEPSQAGVPDVVTSSFKLIDAHTFEHINSYVLGTQEEVTKVSVVELSVDGDLGWYIAVGTAIWEDNEAEPSKGRLLLFRTQSGKPRTAAMNTTSPTVLLSMEAQIPGSVVDMEVVDGKLAIIVNTILIIYAVRHNNVTGDLELKALDQWVHSYALWKVVVTNDLDIVVGDSMQSVTLLGWTKGNAQKEGKLEYIAQDWSSLNSMNITADEESIIQSDIDGHLTSFEIRSTSDKLQQTGHYFFSENISHLMPAAARAIGRVDRSLLTPKHLILTSGGRISTISRVDESLAGILHNIQRNISTAFKQDHYNISAWRAPRIRHKTSDDSLPAYGFIDGDLLAKFLELDPASPKVKVALQGTNSAERLEMEYPELRRIIEELQIAQ